MSKKGQISAEFLVILGVILVVAMVAVGLTLLFSQSSRDIAENESRAYWASQPQPLRILEYEGFYYSGVPANGEIALLLENVDSKPITIKGFVLEPYDSETSFNVYSSHSTDGSTNPSTLIGTSGFAAKDGLTVELAPSERYTFYLRPQVACSTSEDGRANTEFFENELTIYYDTPYFSGLSFKGVKNIVGRCNQN